VIDFDEFEAAGIANARDRAPLIEYLDDLGFSVAEMAQAEREGRLYALAGDALIRSGPSTFSLRSAAAELDLPLADVEQIWAVLGFATADPDEVMLNGLDVAAIATCAETRTILGDEAALGVLRVVGASVSRIAEAQLSATRLAVPDLWLDASRDELTTARAFREIAAFFPPTVEMVSAVYRRHMIEMRKHIEAVLDGSSMSVVCGVGFADLSSFTSLTQTLTAADLSALLTDFSAAVTDVVHVVGGRVVKFIGDEVMFAFAHPGDACTCARRLFALAEVATIPGIRIGIATGEVISRFGDYYGPVVNVAARLVQAAPPGCAFVTSEVASLVENETFVNQGDRELRGIAEPVCVMQLV